MDIKDVFGGLVFLVVVVFLFWVVSSLVPVRTMEEVLNPDYVFITETAIYIEHNARLYTFEHAEMLDTILVRTHYYNIWGTLMGFRARLK